MRKLDLARRMITCVVPIVLAFVLPVFADSPDLTFKLTSNGVFDFNTGVVKGKLRADEKSQGILSFVDVQSGTELAYGGDNPGILSYYRLFSANKRYAEAARGWPKSSMLLSDGAVQIKWPPRDEHPIEMIAIYRWKTSGTLDLETLVRPTIDMKDFEVFLSSYFNKNFRSLVYVKAPLHRPGKPSFLSADVNPLVRGTYLAFPRDRRAAQIIYDGRWEYGPNPVQFSVAQLLAAPLCMKRDSKSDVAFLLMSHPDDCFAIETSYNMDPPDGIAGHCSMYLSLFGKDIRASETARVLVRLVVGRNITERDALDLYENYLREK